jgi:hypothetical protein
MKKLIMSCLSLPLFFGAMSVYAGGTIFIQCPQVPETFEVGDQFQAPPSDAQPYWLTTAWDYKKGTILTVQKDSKGNTIVYNGGGSQTLPDGSLSVVCSGYVTINNDPMVGMQVYWEFYSFDPNKPTSCGPWTQSSSGSGFYCSVN